MGTPIWLRLCMVFNALLFLLGSYMAASAVEIARVSDGGAAWGIALFFIALPVFALACSVSAVKVFKQGRSRHAAGMMLTPTVYAVFLVLLLAFG